MTVEEFNRLVEDTFNHIKSVLVNKTKEYTYFDDKLYNFKQAAHLQKHSQFEALGGMMAKHIVSVYDYIRDVGVGVHHSMAAWDEKIIDAINYLILLRAMVKENERKISDGVVCGSFSSDSTDNCQHKCGLSRGEGNYVN